MCLHIRARAMTWPFAWPAQSPPSRHAQKKSAAIGSRSLRNRCPGRRSCQITRAAAARNELRKQQVYNTMGAGASQSFFEKDEALEVPDAPDNIKALASRLSQAHGIHEAILVHGLVALEPCVQRRLNRAITKPLDLACLRAFKAEMEGQGRRAGRSSGARRTTGGHQRKGRGALGLAPPVRRLPAAHRRRLGGPLQALRGGRARARDRVRLRHAYAAESASSDGQSLL